MTDSRWPGQPPPPPPPPPGSLPPPPGPAPFAPRPAPYTPAGGYGLHPFASWGARLGALILDALIVGVPYGVVFFVAAVSVPTELAVCTDLDGTSYLCERPTGAGVAILAAVWLLSIVVAVWYLGWRQGATGSTLGKKALNIRVIDQHSGQPIGGGRGIGRYFAAILSALPCYLGYLWPLWDDKNQTWHDKIVSSIVIHDRR